MVDTSEVAAVVIDNGTGMTKAGIAGEDAPKCSFPTLVGRSKMPGIMVSMDQPDTYVGEEAFKRRGLLKLTAPVEHGVIKEWEEMEKIWHHCYYNELKVPPEEHPCMLTEPPLTDRKTRERMTEMMFETFNVPSFYVGVQSVLALYATGRTTGVIVESGEGVTHTVPIYEGYCSPHTINKSTVAGRDVTHYLLQLLQEVGQSFSTATEKDVIRDIKEKCCYIADDYAKELRESKESSAKDVLYELPDGSTVVLGSQRFQCSEVMFTPKLIGRDDVQGIHDMCYESIMRSEPDVRKELYERICLSGGNTLYEGFQERLQSSISSLAQQKIRVWAPAERKYSVWIGGSILSSLSTFSIMWITNQEYNERGFSVLDKKCF